MDVKEGRNEHPHAKTKRNRANESGVSRSLRQNQKQNKNKKQNQPIKKIENIYPSSIIITTNPSPHHLLHLLHPAAHQRGAAYCNSLPSSNSPRPRSP